MFCHHRVTLRRIYDICDVGFTGAVDDLLVESFLLLRQNVISNKLRNLVYVVRLIPHQQIHRSVVLLPDVIDYVTMGYCLLDFLSHKLLSVYFFSYICNANLRIFAEDAQQMLKLIATETKKDGKAQSPTIQRKNKRNGQKEANLRSAPR